MNTTSTLLTDLSKETKPSSAPPTIEPFTMPISKYSSALEQFKKGVETYLPMLLDKIALYIDSPLTQAILFRPIKVFPSILRVYCVLENSVVSLSASQRSHSSDPT